MSRFTWTPELDAELLRLKGEKKTAKEIAYALGTNEKCVGNRLWYLKKKEDASTVPASGEGKVGELGDLEAAMAETITELTAERDALADKLAVCEKDYRELLQKNENGLSRIAELLQTVEQLRSELEDTNEALARTEEQLDEERHTAEAQLGKVVEQIKTISKLEARVASLERELEGGERRDCYLQGDGRATERGY